jgi:hypothetical protein
MKKVFMVISILLIAVLAFGQQVADTIPIVHTTGESLQDFFTNNAWNLALIVFLLVSEWLGSTGKVKEGSIYAWIINMIGKIIRGKADVIKTKKAKFLDDADLLVEAKERSSTVFRTLKILIIGLFLFSVTAKAQGPWDGFFKPAKSNIQLTKAVGDKKFDFKFRPAAEMTAVQVLYDKETKTWNSSTFHSAGLGLGLQHYVEGVNGPVNNYGFNLLCMLDASPVEDKGAGFGLAATVNVPNFVTIGGGYNFTFKQPYILLGAVYNF